MSQATLYSVSYDISDTIASALGSVLPSGSRAVVTSSGVVTGFAVVIFAVIILAATMLNTILLIWWERKLLGRFMDRRG
ncbi:MAG: hypothetical protein ACLQHA_08465, partial [Thermoplasmata archaeon]